MSKNSSKTINYIGYAIGAYFIGTAIAGAIKRRREGIGKVERIKRRIYKEVSLAQDAGVDFSKKYAELNSAELDALQHIGQDVVGWKQSKRAIENGKPYTESYYGSLRRAWNAVSGIQGIGTAYNVKDANGNVVLTWIEDAQAHVDAEREIEEKRQRTLEAEKRAAESRKRLQRNRRAIQRGETPTEPSESIAPKAPTKAELKRKEFAERQLFAEEFLSEYTERDGKESFAKYINQTDPNGTPIHILIADSFAKGELKVNDKNGKIDVYINGEWIKNASLLYVLAADLLQAWKTRGLRSDNLDEIRKQLLERAKFMAVSDDGTFGGAPIQGDERYNYLDKINWIVVFFDYYQNGEKTIYPYRAFEEEWDANTFADQYKRLKNNTSLGLRRQVKVMPITELDVNSISGISGIGYAPNVESELYEIWIEQLNNDYTDYDYDTWRSIYGDEYAKSDVLPYMNL